MMTNGDPEGLIFLSHTTTNNAFFFLLTIYFLLAHLSILVSSADSLYPDQAQQNVGPHLDPNCLTLMVQNLFLKALFEKDEFENKFSRRQNDENYPATGMHLSTNCMVNLRLNVGD